MGKKKNKKLRFKPIWLVCGQNETDPSHWWPIAWTKDAAEAQAFCVELEAHKDPDWGVTYRTTSQIGNLAWERAQLRQLREVDERPEFPHGEFPNGREYQGEAYYAEE